MAGAVCLLAFSVLYGWNFNVPYLVQFSPSVPPIQPNTVLSLLLLSLGILGDNRRISGLLGGVLAFGIGLITLIDYFYTGDLITTLAVPFGTDLQIVPSRMAFNTTIAMLLLSFSLVSLHVPRMKPAPAFVCTLSLVAGSIGLVSLFGYYFQLETAYSWYGYAKMSPISAVSICAISGSMVLSALTRFSGFRQQISWAAMVSLVAGCAVSIFMWAMSVASQSTFIENEISFDSKKTTTLLQNELQSNIDLLQSIERFFASSDDVSRQEFKTFVDPLVKNRQGLVGIDWAPFIPGKDRTEVEQSLKQQGFSDFQFLQLDQKRRLEVRTPNDEYFPVLYTEPFESNRKALGFDHWSDPLRRSAMQSAIQKNAPVATEIFKLFRFDFSSKEPTDFLIIVPNWNTKTAKINGFIIGVFRTADLAQSALGNASDFQVTFTDTTAGNKKSFLSYPTNLTTDESVNTLGDSTIKETRQEKLFVADRVWTISLVPTEKFYARFRNWHSTLILFTCLLATFFLSFYILALRRQNEREKTLLNEKTKEINERRKAEEVLHNEASRQANIVATQQEIVCARHGLETMLRLITERTRQITGADGSVIEIIEEDFMHYRATAGTASPYQGIRISRHNSLSGLAAKKNEVLRCDDSETDPRVDREACRRVGLRSMVVVPLHHDGEVVGVLKVFSAKVDAFNEADVIALRMMASLMSGAFSNAIAAEALAEKNILLERATAFKSQFLANMSHEIRTPLTGIIGYSESLMHDSLTLDEHAIAVETILHNSNHLLGVINDILDFSKIEAGKLDVELLPSSLFDIISDIGNLMQHKAMDQGISFGFEYQFPLPETIQTDVLRVKQILINLIGNAIKFTQKGGVKVLVSADPQDQTIRFAITDTGIGLSEEEQQKLFQAFSQADTSTTRRFGGTGLGLVISHQLAVKLGGNITVESTSGKGSTFSFVSRTGPQDLLIDTKPKQTRCRKDTFPQMNIQLKGKVLVAEDGPANQQYLSFILQKANVDFALVENGSLAVDAVSKQNFDLILMDMQMPVMDGYTATKTLRSMGCRIPIIALTANIMKQDVQMCVEAGCTDFLGKPFERSAFYKKLSVYLESGSDVSANLPIEENPIFPLLEDEDMLPIAFGFVENLPTRIIELETALTENNNETSMTYAHRLRGSAMFGYPQLGEIAGKIEDGIHYNNGDIPLLLNQLKNVCARIKIGKERTNE